MVEGEGSIIRTKRDTEIQQMKKEKEILFEPNKEKFFVYIYKKNLLKVKKKLL